jgi:hypothetical protein
MRGNPLLERSRIPPHPSGKNLGALRRPPRTRFLCKKPVPGPSAKNSNLLGVDHRIVQLTRHGIYILQ